VPHVPLVYVTIGETGVGLRGGIIAARAYADAPLKEMSDEHIDGIPFLPSSNAHYFDREGRAVWRPSLHFVRQYEAQLGLVLRRDERDWVEASSHSLNRC